jgi:hypothetical protein
MKKIQLLMAIGCILFHSEMLSAQVNPDSLWIRPDNLRIMPDSVNLDKQPVKKSHFSSELTYQSNDVYLGRKDSAVLPYYIPAISYYHKSGLYATASVNYLKNATSSRIDLVTLEAGYMFSTGQYNGQFTLSKYFYNSQSTSITSEITASAEYQNSYDAGFIRTTFTGTLNIGSKLDFAGLFGLEHTFYLLDERLDFTPTMAIAASTQNYYNDYYKKRRYNIQRIGKPAQTGVASISGTVLNASSFKILDYEPTMPVNYTIGKCTFNFTPTYSIPVNAATVAIHTIRSNGHVLDRTRDEKIENTFYFCTGVSFLF